MKALVEVAGGSITGRDHLLVGKNNQDAYYWVNSDEFAIAVVCDGCGSGAHSEVGAKIGAVLVVEAIAKALASGVVDDAFWQQVQQNVLIQLQSLAKAMGSNLYRTVSNYFLFTIVGALVTPIEAFVFSIGDGVIIVNGKLMQIGPFPGNAPPYLAYDLVNTSAESLPFQVHERLPIGQLESILIGTDGISDLIKIEACNLPGKEDKVGEINQFWQEDRYFKNTDMIRRHLSLINRHITKPDWQNQQVVREVGLLPDDTTLIVIRRQH